MQNLNNAKQSITGPTLPILASNMNVSLATANWSITVRSISGFGF